MALLKSIQIFIPRSEGRDAIVLLQVGGEDGLHILRALGVLQSA
jgi:hypothetical protein